jgi:hypothetical protein
MSRSLLLLSLLLTGCTRTITQQLVHYRPGDPPTTRPAPHYAVYQVKILHDGKYRGINGTTTLVNAGESLGFRTTEDGTVHALTERGTISLQIPAGKQLVWWTRTEKQTAFGRGVDQTVAALGAAAVVAGEAALVGAGLYLATLDNDDCHSSSDSASNSHHHKHHDPPPVPPHPK